ncbi:RYamide receptor-like [Maniola hyperantus]|uniref:RYamide receptor-like n=1 Tax=Aphantopus hyperantus TaxID=2795564 RepID=UPI001568D927|nr:RYamide receptor-like [Maniola hyperantus]
MLHMSNFTTHNVEVRYTCSVADCNANITQETNRTEVNDTLPYEYVCILKPQPEDFVSSCFFQICVYALYGIIFIVALLGNGLVCFVVHSSPRMKTVTNYFIMNLAVGDIMMTLFCVPFSFVSMLLLRYWPFGSVMCKVVNYSQAVSVLVSAYTLLAISIDRYFVIMHPLKPRLSKMAAKLVMSAVWSGALATAAPILIVSQLQKPSMWHQVCELDICSERWANAEQSAQYTWALLVLQFALPLCALICTYGRIAYVVWAVRPPGEAETIRDSRIQHSKRKMVKMMITVVAVFTICWLPLNIFIMLWTAHEDDEEWGKWPGLPYVWFVSHWLAMSHCCCNPIIYCYMNVRYRSGFKQVLGKILCLNNNDGSRSHHRSSVCEGVPLSEMVGVDGSMRQRCLTRCRCTFSNTDGSRKCMSTCFSVRQHKSASRTVPPRAASVRSHFE